MNEIQHLDQAIYALKSFPGETNIIINLPPDRFKGIIMEIEELLKTGPVSPITHKINHGPNDKYDDVIVIHYRGARIVIHKQRLTSIRLTDPQKN